MFQHIIDGSVISAGIRLNSADVGNVEEYHRDRVVDAALTAVQIVQPTHPWGLVFRDEFVDAAIPVSIILARIAQFYADVLKIFI